MEDPERQIQDHCKKVCYIYIIVIYMYKIIYNFIIIRYQCNVLLTVCFQRCCYEVDERTRWRRCGKQKKEELEKAYIF